MRSLTMAVASYQGRADLVRLVVEVGAQAERAPDTWEGVELLVVLDGSTDGSTEALAALEGPVPVRVLWRPNAGLAATRNVCLGEAGGELIWFLDDDLVPDPGALGRHRAAHDPGCPLALVGPCALPDTAVVDDETRRWWEELNAAHTRAGRIESVSQFPVHTANLSAPTAVLRSIGGFDESFLGYGMEDCDLALRLLEAGLPILYDGGAVCWHHTSVDPRRRLPRRRNEGRNTARFIAKHPHVADEYFPSQYPSRALRVLDRAGVRSPRLLWASARVAEAAHRAGRRAGRLVPSLPGRSDALWRAALDAGYLAGMAEVDPGLLPYACGRPRPRTPPVRITDGARASVPT